MLRAGGHLGGEARLGEAHVALGWILPSKASSTKARRRANIARASGLPEGGRSRRQRRVGEKEPQGVVGVVEGEAIDFDRAAVGAGASVVAGLEVRQFAGVGKALGDDVHER